MITIDEQNLIRFEKVDIFEQGIEQTNRSLKERQKFFLETPKKETLKIFFVDSSGLRKIETKVWTIAKQAIILKKSKVIPLASIVAVA